MRRRTAVLPLLVLCAAAGGCASGAAAPPQASTPQRIVSLAPSVTEVLFDAGCGPRLVGVTSYCEFPSAAVALPKVGGYLTPSYEAVSALRPSVVVVLPEHEDARRFLTALGLDVVEFDHRTVRGIVDSLVAAGRLCDTPDRASAAAADLDAVLRRTEARVAGRPRPRVVVSATRGGERGFGTVSAAGPGSIHHDLLVRAGGSNAVPPGPVRHPALSAEGLIRLDPDAIVELAAGADDGRAIRDEWRVLPSLAAVQEGRVFVFTDDFLPVPGPRLVRFVERLADVLHPVTRPGVRP